MKPDVLTSYAGKPIVILHFSETIRGGVGTVIGQLLASQSTDSRVRAVHVLAPRHGSEILGSGKKQESHLFDGRRRGLIALIQLALVFLRLITKINPDVVHLHSSFAGLVGRLVLLMLRPRYRPRVIYCPHAFAFLMSTGMIKRRIFAFIERVLAYQTDLIICVSASERNEAVKQGIRSEKLEIIYNGVKEVALTRRSLQSVRIELLFVGRLDHQKGFDVLMQAISTLDPARFHLTVVGEAVVAEFDRELLPQVTYVGWKNQVELDGYYRACDVLVMPSRWEGFAMVPLEAASRGVGLLCSSLDSTRELIADGVDGKLFAVGDVDALRTTLLSISKEQWHSMGSILRDKVRKNFSLRSMEEKTLACYWPHLTTSRA